MKKRKKKENNIVSHKNENENPMNRPIFEDNNNKINISSSVANNISIEKLSKVMTFNTKRTIARDFLFDKEEEKNENVEENVEKEKEEKKRIENEERQLLYYYEEKDEIEFEELNKIAQIILNRISEKLNGTDFNNDKPLSINEQIDRLIKQATSNENLAQSYLGWCPFW